jgi:hypothetical protein
MRAEQYNLHVFCYLEAHAKLQNPTETHSHRNVRASEEEEEKRKITERNTSGTVFT